jgi:hypothetical protein
LACTLPRRVGFLESVNAARKSACATSESCIPPLGWCIILLRMLLLSSSALLARTIPSFAGLRLLGILSLSSPA